MLVPEIGLTPQLLRRFRKRLGLEPAVIHSGLGAGSRLESWAAARAGRASLVVGTRSALFTPLPSLGMIILDEEHDASFKQQDGFRYSARDIAVKRAAELDIPVVLGSATPSLESLHNAAKGRYSWHRLRERATRAPLPPGEYWTCASRAPPMVYPCRRLKPSAKRWSAGSRSWYFSTAAAMRRC